MSGGTQTTTTRPNPTGDSRIPGITGLGGFGLPDMEHTLNGIPDAAQLNQFLQNPAVSQMMQSLLSNPQYMNQVTTTGITILVEYIIFPEIWAFSMYLIGTFPEC